MDEIIEHENQTFLDDFLKEEKCLKCRNFKDDMCIDKAAMLNYNGGNKCDGYYPLNDRELCESTDKFTEKMEF